MKQKIFTWKYLFTRGIIETNAEIQSDGTAKKDIWNFGYQYSTDEKEAKREAEKKRKDKILSLQKQIAKMEAIQF